MVSVIHWKIVVIKIFSDGICLISVNISVIQTLISTQCIEMLHLDFLKS